MVPKKLTSLQHPFVKYLVALRKDRSFREEEKKVLVTGKAVILELFAKGVVPKLLITTGEKPLCASVDTLEVPPSLWEKITGLSSGDGLIALMEVPSWKEVKTASHLLILDEIKDPGNLGTLLRTAKAFGWGGVFLTTGCCDPFNDKALRAAKGAPFLLPMQRGSFEEINSFPHKLLIAHMEGTNFAKVSIAPPLGLVLSHEGKGASKALLAKFTPITIPMEGGLESLNVSSAGAILLRGLKEMV